MEVDLKLIQQGPKESLREYISLFNKEARAMNNL